MNWRNLIKSKTFIIFLIYGIVIGSVSIIIWPRDPTWLFILNGPSLWLGDILYIYSIKYLGDPHSSYAHFTVPWIFRIPQVYFLTSVLFWGLLGGVICLVNSKRRGID
jgi:hypothetical protein